MEIQLLWWHWMVLGMLLMLAEIFVPSFTIFWFGLAGLVVAVLLWLAPELAISWQVVIWALASIGFTIAWFRFFKPTMTDRTKAGLSREAVVGEIGQVIRDPQDGRRGVVRFSLPLLGDDEWEFVTTEELKVGDRVVVVDVSGNTLVVAKKGN
ncbi:membrane protein [Desulfuromonas versatilis]|uniref:Membrane protein n=1 Tax=Desulfuromonas versatilis TaxID=2802975 RepID=A0ABM8HVF5_9BACT|nr:NfeD family protein [Desulfuromonas versatilis]BCR04704.1 membrane protein [Desulfuromonas versatilis]